MKITTKILVACLPAIVTGALFAASTGDRAVNKPDESALAKAKASLDKLPLSFEPNRGQTDSRVQFLSRGPGYTVFFTKDETVFSLKDTKTSDAVVRMKFVGGTNSASPHPVEGLAAKSNYLIGNDSSKWVTGLSQYSKLRYENVYPGIDVVYQGEHKQLRYDFIVKAGASASAIQMAFEGADKISVTNDGDLALTIDGKTLITRKPLSYQEDGGAKKEVASHFVVKNGRVSFELAKYDTTKDLVIDPTVVFVTFLGGLLNDSVNGVAIVNPTLTISSLPSAYFVTGTTTSTNFPTTAGVLTGLPGGLNGNTLSGVNDVFVSKISFNGSQLLWSTFLGGNSQDSGAAIAVDAVSNTAAANCTLAGCPVVVGQTFSANFPVAGFQVPNLSGSSDAFAAKLAPDGTKFIWSTYLGGTTNDFATGVAIDLQGNTFVGGYTDSPFFICPGNSIPPVGSNQCTNANHVGQTTSSDAFVVKIPLNFAGFNSLQVALYGGFGEEFARGIAYNPVNNMVYLAGDTTTATQNFISPNNVNLPGITNQTAVTGLPGPGPNARGGFVVAFDATSFVRTFATYVAVSPNTGACGGGIGAPCNQGTETITGIAAEGGAPAAGCSVANLSCTPTSTATASISATFGNIGHVYITGDTTSHVPSSSIAAVVPTASCTNPLAAASVGGQTSVIGPNGTPVVIPGGLTTPAGCTTALITQTPFSTNQADVSTCAYPLVLPQTPSLHCNLSAYVAILDGALLTVPGGNPAPVGNQIEYWAYYSSPNSSTQSNAIAIDVNPTTLSSVYSLGTYQQMYITGSTQNTGAGGFNALPVTNAQGPTEIFTTYNVGTTGGGGVGGYTPFGSTTAFEIDAYVARFNANGVVASAYGGQGAAGTPLTNNMGYGCPVPLSVWGVPCTGQNVAPQDHSYLIHTPQFNFGEFFYGLVPNDGFSTPSTIGNAIAVDPTRAVLIGGATNVSNSTGGKVCNPASVCSTTTTNNLAAIGGQNNGGNDGWVSVLFFNDILTDAASISSANPFLQPGFIQDTLGVSYIETTPAPFGPTFDFALSDPATQTQTFRVLFTGQTAGQLAGQTPWFVPLDPRSGATQPTLDNGLPGSGIAYYVPCVAAAAPGTLIANGAAAPNSAGYYNNAYPAPGSPYGPITCAFPSNHLYEGLPILFSGYPGLTAGNVGAGNLVTPGWLIVSQDISPGVVRLQLDRRAAAGLLEGTYIAQFLVTTYDSQHGPTTASPQWPPCGPQSALNPFIVNANVTCTNAATPLPADNHSILVTVRLIVRPTLFLSRNAGILTGITSSPAANPLFGPNPAGTVSGLVISTQQGTSQVPDWYYTGANNDITTWPAAGNFGLGTIFGAGNNGVNSGPPTCVPGLVNGITVANVNPIVPPLGNPANPVALPNGVTVPCPVSATAPSTFGTGVNAFGYGAAAYLGNGPGDLSGPGGAIGAVPNMSFQYDSGTVLVITPNATEGLTNCNKFAADITNNATANECNLSIESNLAPSRPDQPVGVTTFNALWQGGQDPVTQRNDATVQDYYVTAEGNAVISVAAINCTNWNPTQGHVNAVGNWLGVRIGGVALSALGAPTPASYTPICSDLTATTVGTARGMATGCATGCTYSTGATIGDDAALPGAIGGQKIVLDFVTKAYTGGCSGQAAAAATASTSCTTSAGVGPRAAMNGIPTGVYTADVYVWSTRAKNSVPGYCLGASMPAASGAGVDPTPLCTPSTTAIATTANPNPEILVTGQQTFHVTLNVFDTTQIIQLTPNTCPTPISTPNTEFATIGGISENDFTGNIAPPYGPGSVPNYANFGANASQLVEWSLLPFQTTGTSVTGCYDPTAACPSPIIGNPNGGTNINTPVPLPQGVTVNPQTLAQYNACALPTGSINTTISAATATALGIAACSTAPCAINGGAVPGIGSLVQTGPLSQSTFVPSGSVANPKFTLYACRPTVAPAWLNSPLYPGNSVTFPGSPEPYGNGNGPFGGSPVAAVAGCSAPGDPAKTATCVAGQGPVPSVTGITCPLAASSGTNPGGGVFAKSELGVFRSPNSYLEDTNGSQAFESGPDKFLAAFFTGVGGVNAQAGDIAVSGDWVGDGIYRIGVYRPSTGQWFLDANNNGIYDSGDFTYNFGGLTSGGNVDTPVVGDWTGNGRSCIGIYRSNGSVWLLDLNCNGTFDNTPTDAFFPFGGLAGDVPVVGNWTGAATGWRVGVVRKYAPGGVPQGNPFFWVYDAGNANAGNTPALHPAAANAYAFGGLTGDVFVTGDWTGSGVWRAGVYRSGSWIEDLTGAHTPDTFFQFGGCTPALCGAGIQDQPIVGKNWH